MTLDRQEHDPSRPGRITASLALAGLRDPVREAAQRARDAGVRAVQLDATHPQTRPRDLDRSARRDLAAMLRRAELGLTGLDLWIPETHLADPEQIDRALDAVRGAVELCADLAGLMDAPEARTLSLSLPADIPAEALGVIESGAERHGVRVADHAQPDPLVSGPIGIGLDPAGVLVTGADPVELAFSRTDDLRAARLSDIAGAGRVFPGTRGGRLDLAAYAAALVTVGHIRHVALDVRGLPEPWRGIGPTVLAWAAATSMV